MSDYNNTFDTDRLANVVKDHENRIQALEQLFVEGRAMDEFAPSIGAPGEGTDGEGLELTANNDLSAGDNTGWSASTGVNSWNGAMTSLVDGTMNAISDRFAVDAGGFLRVYFDGPKNTVISSRAAKIEWYDSLVGGSLIYTDLLPDDLPVVLNVPTGAAAARWNVTVHVNSGFSVLDNFSAKMVVYANSFTLDPVPSIQFNGDTHRIAAGARAWFNPGYWYRPSAALVATAAGNLTNGVYSYKISFVDADGESLASERSATVTVDGTHKQVTVTIKAPPAGITSIRIYRTAAGGGTYGLLATVAAGTTSYTDNIADASLGAAPPEENTTLTRPVMPTFHSWLINVAACNVALARVASTSELHNEYWEAAGNGNLAVFPGFLAERGRYRLYVTGIKNSGHGMLDWYADGYIIATGQDWYNASQLFNQTLTVDFVVIESGWHQLAFVVNGQNPSAIGNYYFRLTEVRIERIGR